MKLIKTLGAIACAVALLVGPAIGAEEGKAKEKTCCEKAKAEGKEFTKVKPWSNWKPTELYNGMIAPIIPFAIKGAIWYQGESNARRAHQYRRLFADMIKNWRRDWREGDFPFLEGGSRLVRGGAVAQRVDNRLAHGAALRGHSTIMKPQRCPAIIGANRTTFTPVYASSAPGGNAGT